MRLLALPLAFGGALVAAATSRRHHKRVFNALVEKATAPRSMTFGKARERRPSYQTPTVIVRFRRFNPGGIGLPQPERRSYNLRRATTDTQIRKLRILRTNHEAPPSDLGSCLHVRAKCTSGGIKQVRLGVSISPKRRSRMTEVRSYGGVLS